MKQEHVKIEDPVDDKEMSPLKKNDSGVSKGRLVFNGYDACTPDPIVSVLVLPPSVPKHTYNK